MSDVDDELAKRKKNVFKQMNISGKKKKTETHEAFTRYPDGIITPEDYESEKVGIVKTYDRIYGVVEIAVNTSFNYMVQK